VAASASFVFLKQVDRDAQGHRYYQVVDELEADELGSGKLTLSELARNRKAWLT
jgi:hypothetical protein